MVPPDTEPGDEEPAKAASYYKKRERADFRVVRGLIGLYLENQKNNSDQQDENGSQGMQL